MKQLIVHVLCEGQTEEEFCKCVNRSGALERISLKAVLVTTSAKKKAAGGGVTWDRVKAQLTRMISSAIKRNSSEHEHHVVSTMIDLYGLPAGYPGADKPQSKSNPTDRVRCVEEAVSVAMGNNQLFIPYFQLHEFEALIFADLEKLFPTQNEKEEQALERLQAVLNGKNNSEEINTGKGPSKHLDEIFLSCLGEEYNKIIQAKKVISATNLDTLTLACPHFGEWISRLESARDQFCK